MDAQSDRGLVWFFMDVSDPRAENALHRLTDIFSIAICAVLGQADNWVAVAEYGRTKLAFFKSFLKLEHGIPSHDTFERVFAAINPDEFEKCFVAWTTSLAKKNSQIKPASTELKTIAIDGKSMRRTFKHNWDKSCMTHIVSAFATHNSLLFSQIKTDKKSNEITAIPKILEFLDVAGAIITIDAMGCQKEIAQKIIDKKADYILALKDNHPELSSQVKSTLDEAIKLKFADMPYSYHEQTNAGHGRIEMRQTWITTDIGWLGERAKQWSGLAALIVIKSTRTLNGKTTENHRYYISSKADMTAEQAALAIRNHWKIENQLHWVLDVVFDEDRSRNRNGHGAENFSRLERIALNLLRMDKTKKGSLKIKRLIAAWDEQYLKTLLLG